jgi:molybdenum cofactor synthesis domain-containing protein
MSRTAGIVVIGNEILSGRIKDENTPFLVTELRALGVELRRLALVPDEVPAIRDEVRSASEHFDYVFTSGGVGPTHDDVTMSAIAEAFVLETSRHAELEAILHGYYQEAITEATLRMANVPDGAVLEGDGGGWFPVIRVRNVYVFPGVPEILRSKFLTIREHFREDPFFVSELYMRADEGRVAELLEHILEECPGVRIGSYPVFGRADYSLRLSLEGKDPPALEAALAALVDGLESLEIPVLDDLDTAPGQSG